MAFKRATCAFCRKRFDGPTRQGQIVHVECAAAYAVALREKRARAAQKANRQELAKRKAALKTPTKLLQECRQIVQWIARMRDRDDGCISCEREAGWGGQWHGSHFRSHGACSSLQLHLWNIHKACWICNKLYSGRIDQYKPRLVHKLGAEKVEWLLAQPKQMRFSREYLERYKRVMGARARRMHARIEGKPPVRWKATGKARGG